MSEFRSVFCDEIKTHLSIREVELSNEAYRHYKRTIILFDEYLCRIKHTEKIIEESVMKVGLKKLAQTFQ